MSFIEVLKQRTQKVSKTIIAEAIVEVNEVQQLEPEKLLRDAGFKIKLIAPTSFGTQIDFAKEYDSKEIENILKNFSIKFKNKSVFIVK